MLRPIHISFMLACHTTSDPSAVLSSAHWNSDVGLKVRDWLIAEGLVDGFYKSTDRGKAWVDFICQTPLPEQEWRLPKRLATKDEYETFS